MQDGDARGLAALQRCQVTRPDGDLFACALARTSGQALLFEGDDVSRTDITPV